MGNRQAAKLVAFLAGVPAEAIWKDIDDLYLTEEWLVGMLELLTNEVKPVLEEKARAPK